MESVWSNRILIVLGALGIFITGVLSYTTMNDLMPSCGGNMGCAFLAASDYAKLGGISVSYIGLAGYIALFALAIVRLFVSPKMFKVLSVVGFIMAVSGMFFSIYLTYVALAIIQQKCPWCLASLATIVATTMAYGALMQFDSPKKKDFKLGAIVAVASLVVALGAIKFETDRATQDPLKAFANIDVEKYNMDEILPAAAKVKGNDDAPVTVIEFADINCPLCRVSHYAIDGIQKEYGGRVRIGFRHYPLIQLPGHQTSVALAMLSEVAADNGTFWEFMDKIMMEKYNDRIKTTDGFFAVALETGLDIEDVDALFNSDKEEDKARNLEYVDRINEDVTLGGNMRISQTPTYIVYAQGVDPVAVNYEELQRILMTSPYKELLAKK